MYRQYQDIPFTKIVAAGFNAAITIDFIDKQI